MDLSRRTTFVLLAMLPAGLVWHADAQAAWMAGRARHGLAARA
ncbi:hypothetical protein [Rhodopila sp.]